MRVLIAGGGTGGHVYPALTIGKALQEKGAELLFVGTARGLEADVVPREGFSIEYIPVRSFPRRPGWGLVKAGATAVRGFAQAAKVIRRFEPDVCVGTGGYVAGPVILAAALRGVPTLIQEQNAFPGFTNRVLSRFVDRVALGYEEAAGHFPAKDKLVVTGNPVRPEICRIHRSEGARRLGLDPGKKTVLIFGASQGARSINQAVLEGAGDLVRLDAQVLFATGKSGFDAFVKACGERGISFRDFGGGARAAGSLRVYPYIYDMPAALAASDLVVARAGAGSISEFCARGLPAVLVPYPHAAANHQEYNARVLEARGAAIVVKDADFSANRLLALLAQLLGDAGRLRRMSEASARLGRPDAVWDIVAMVEALAAGNKA